MNEERKFECEICGVIHTDEEEKKGCPNYVTCLVDSGFGIYTAQTFTGRWSFEDFVHTDANYGERAALWLVLSAGPNFIETEGWRDEWSENYMEAMNLLDDLEFKDPSKHFDVEEGVTVRVQWIDGDLAAVRESE